MPENASQKLSSSFRLAELDPDFLLGESMRGVRFFLEFAKAEERLRSWGIRSTVVVFGSARPLAGERAGRWYAQARRFGQIVSQRGGAMTPVDGWRDNVIATGGGPGLMEAANRGAFEAGGKSVGLAIALPMEEAANTFVTPGLSFKFHYFALRKMHFMMRAKAMVAFPGGFGTLDELFEVITLVQTRKSKQVPIVLFGTDYWKRLIDFDVLIEEGVISPADLDLFQHTDDPAQAWDIIKTFYRL